jgi:hypothetical protein
MADFDARHWQYQRTVKVETAGRVYAVTLDRAVYAGAQAGLGDLRLAFNGHETPYVLAASQGTVTAKELSPAVFNRVVVPAHGLQLTLDAGQGQRHNQLRIATGLQNFRIPVKIETSEDGHNWDIARSDGSVFDFSQADRHADVLSVDYPLSTRRYVRATFIGWMRTNAVTLAWLTQYGESETVWQTLATLTPSRIEADGVTNLVFDLGAPHLPYTRIRLDSDAAQFYRACELGSSADGKAWTYVATQTIYRLKGDESLTLSFPGRQERYVRVRIRNGQDRPIAVRQATFEAVQQRLRFLPQTPGAYTLYYGNPKVQAPVYDLGMILAKRAPEQEIVLAAGPQGLTPDYRPDEPVKPWSERHPEVLYVTLGLALVGMGWYCVRFLREVKRAA